MSNNTRTTATLLISCRDRKGIVATVAEFVTRNNGNILHAEQHTDKQDGVFFQRLEWEMDNFSIAASDVAQAVDPIAKTFEMTWGLHFSDYTPRIAILVSRQAHCLYDLLARHQLGEIAADIPLVISNHPHLVQAAQRFGIDYHHLPVTADTKAAQEEQVIDLLERNDIDLVVLARYMQILSPELVRRYPGRIINIHHSSLPAFAGARPYQQAHDRGVKIIGATAHYVTEDLDQGPIIEQDIVRVSHRDSVADLDRAGRDLEKVVLARAVDLHLGNRTLIYGNKTVVFS